MGDVVNLSARLMGYAMKYGPQICCDEVTKSATRGVMHFEGLGKHKMKGKVNEVSIFSPVLRGLMWKKQNFTARTHKIRPHAKNPGNRLIHSRRKKTLSACNASYSARIKPNPQPTCPDGLPVSAYLAFRRKVLVRRDMLEKRRKFRKHNY